MTSSGMTGIEPMVLRPDPIEPGALSVTDIDGVTLSARSQIVDERGRIVHMLRADDPEYVGFGEVYFSWVRPGVVKGWHLHRNMTLNYTCPVGRIRLALHDARKDSPSYGKTRDIELSPSNHWLVTVPPGVWNGFIGIGSSDSMVCNCATLPHDPLEIERRDPTDPFIDYQW